MRARSAALLVMAGGLIAVSPGASGTGLGAGLRPALRGGGRPHPRRARGRGVGALRAAPPRGTTSRSGGRGASTTWPLNEATSSTYITGGQLAQTWNYRPDLITLTIGEENNTIVNLVTDCFDKINGLTTSAAAMPAPPPSSPTRPSGAA